MKYLNFAKFSSNSSRPECVITLIDLSGSMNDSDWKPTRKAGAIMANIELIRTKARLDSQDSVGIIGFHRKARLLHQPVCLSHGAASLIRSLKSPPDGGSTNFTAALELAQEILFKSNKKSSQGLLSRLLSEILYETESHPAKKARGFQNGTVKRIIMLTDGEHNQGGSPITVASRLKNSGVIIDCIGIGGSPKDVDEKLLKKIASRNPDGSIRYCFIGDQQQLLRKYENLARHIRAI